MYMTMYDNNNTLWSTANNNFSIFFRNETCQALPVESAGSPEDNQIADGSAGSTTTAHAYQTPALVKKTILAASPLAKKKKMKLDEAADQALIKSLQGIQERAAHRQERKEDLDDHFGKEVAGRLKRLTPQQNAAAKLQIQQVLYNFEFCHDHEL